MRFAALLCFALPWTISSPSAFAEAGAPPPPLAIEAPECVASLSGRADCLARDRTGAFIWSYHDGRKWSRPQRVSGQFTGAASCVVRGPLGLNCFAIHADGTLWHSAMNGGVWRAWRPLGGRLAPGRPSCVAPARNQILCHARSANGTLAVKAWLGDTSWQEWRDAGGSLASDPSCVRLDFERVACFWRRADGRFAGLLPAAKGPGSALLTLPRQTGRPVCVSLDGARAACRAKLDDGKILEWRGLAELGGAGLDGFVLYDTAAKSDPVCTSRSGRVYCAYLAMNGEFVVAEANAKGWTAPVAMADPGAALAGRCLAFDQSRMACIVLAKSGELRALFREYNGAPGTGISTLAAKPMLAEKPEPPPLAAAAAPPPPTPSISQAAPAAVAPVSIREPLGVWRVFEPRTGLHCQITLFDAPAQPYRRLTLDSDCAAMASLRGVARWSQADGSIVLRDRRGRVFFRFMEAGPTALRARWRRSDFIMMARDLRAFAGKPTEERTEQLPPASTMTTAQFSHSGVWRLRGPGKQSCLVRLTVDPDTAATLARPQGCQGSIARVDGWSVRRGALVLERGGAPVARFVEGRGSAWIGRFEGGRSTLRMIKQ